MRKIALQGIASAISKNRSFVDTHGNQEISREKTGGSSYTLPKVTFMKSHVLFCLRIFVCIFFAGLMLYAYIDQNNSLTAIQQALPKLEREVKAIQLENERIQYEIDRFESPIHLMEQSRQPEFSHLKYPYVRDVVLLPPGILEKK